MLLLKPLHPSIMQDDDSKKWDISKPHTFTRTHELLHEFSTAFNGADEIIVTDIYAAREKDEKIVHSKDLVAKIKEEGKKVTYLAT
ncbi:hypothetical protein ADUPG1_003170, partial [Aduncisulcus paluster]